MLFAAANAPWVTVALRDAAATLEVRGADAAPALSGLALAAIACVGAASIAPRILRYVVAAVLALLGGAAVLLSAAVLADPSSGAERAVSTVTGVGGHDSVRALVLRADPSGWPVAAAAAGVALAGFAAGVAVTARSWPGAGSRYAARKETPADPWDALSRGADPTGGPGDRDSRPPGTDPADPSADPPLDFRT